MALRKRLPMAGFAASALGDSNASASAGSPCAPALVRVTSLPAQMSVELAVAFPVIIIVAVIALNAMLFVSECAAFDNTFRETVRVHATSPAYGDGLEEARASISTELSTRFNKDFEQVSVRVEGVAGGHVAFTGTLSMQPTLFGMGLRSSVMGVSLPSVRHEVSLTIDSYKPGVLL